MTLPIAGIAVLITGVTIAMIAAIGTGFSRGARAIAVGGPGNRDVAVRLVGPLLAGWWLLAVVLAATGFFVAGPGGGPPRVVFALVPIAAGLAIFLSSPAFRRALDNTQPASLVGVQVYRLLGGVFLVGYAFGFVPGVFALPAGLGDVAIGIAAPFVARLLRTRHPWSRRIAVAWNAVGLADLVMAVTLGVLSAPGRLQRLAFDLPNSAISAYPFVLVPTILVPISILLHVFSLRALRKSRENRGESDNLSINRH